ncbi:WSCD family member AAEL009094-like [Panonychus citri]|uniref:WSCD family member AAEL009094-like n=1 Tax=Panonychus citri TaxID=50023 RepID=UPI00230813C4|nr:WSCD family member AAEL009094-like [Panonychus citri]
MLLTLLIIIYLTTLNNYSDSVEISSSLSKSSGNFCIDPTVLPSPRPLTAFVSFPGSGNTWIRYLIQQSSGYLTGSVYHDATLAMKGFPGEGISNGSMVIVKTHEHGPSGRQFFTKAIFLVRNPFKILLSEFNRRSGGHLGHAPVSKFTDTGWKNYVLENVDHWSSFTLDWLNFKGPLLISRYEDFLNNLKGELSRVLSFLEVNFTDSGLDCVDKHRNGWQRRPQHYLPFDPFSMPSGNSSSSSSSLRQVVERKRKQVYQALNNFLRQSGQLSSISELP